MGGAAGSLAASIRITCATTAPLPIPGIAHHHICLCRITQNKTAVQLFVTTEPAMASCAPRTLVFNAAAQQQVLVSHGPWRTPAAGVLDHQRQRRRRRPSFRASGGGAEHGSTCIHAQQQQQQEQEALPSLADAKFQPFAPRNAAHRLISSFRQHRRPLGAPDDGSVLVVQPLTSGWVPAAAELLTDSFAEAISGVGFSRFLRRQVEAYLKQHMLLPPKAVVLVALLLPPPEQQRERQRQWEEARQSTQQDLARSADSSASSSSSDGAWNAASAGGLYPSAADTASANSDASGDTTAPSEDPSSQLYEPAGGGELVAVVELSFSASTRSRGQTLTPPADRPYLCNMATHPAHRRRGYGSELMAAAEALVTSLGEQEVYLHLRWVLAGGGVGRCGADGACLLVGRAEQPHAPMPALLHPTAPACRLQGAGRSRGAAVRGVRIYGGALRLLPGSLAGLGPAPLDEEGAAAAAADPTAAATSPAGIGPGGAWRDLGIVLAVRYFFCAHSRRP